MSLMLEEDSQDVSSSLEGLLMPCQSPLPPKKTNKQTKISHNFIPAINILHKIKVFNLVKLKLENCTLNFEQTKETKRNYSIFFNGGWVGVVLL